MGVKAFPRTAESPHFSRAEKGTHHSLVRGRSAGPVRTEASHNSRRQTGRGQPVALTREGPLSYPLSPARFHGTRRNPDSFSLVKCR